jgi:hypothetical protein
MIERMRTASLPDELAEAGRECLGAAVALDRFGLLLYDSSTRSFRPAGDKIDHFQIADIGAASQYVLETQKVVAGKFETPTNACIPRAEANGSFALVPLTTVRSLGAWESRFVSAGGARFSGHNGRSHAVEIRLGGS